MFWPLGRYGSAGQNATGDVTRDCEKGNLLDFSDERWMSKIDSEVLLSSLSIPGTHDSAAYVYGVPFLATQKMSILQQLNSGIRYLDFRCGIREDIIEMVHGPTYLDKTFTEVMDTVYTWLRSHPTEALLIQLKEDRKPERSKITFADAIVSHISANPDRWSTSAINPRLGELRGKIQLFRRFRTKVPVPFGIDVTAWQDNPHTPFTIFTANHVQLTVQDHYKFTDALPLPELLSIKGGNVSGLLDQASADIEQGHWYLNFTSAFEASWQYQLSPRQIAVGGYWFFRWIDGLNIRLANYMRARERKERFGVLIMDFPEQGADDLIHQLILSNFKRTTSASMWLYFCLGLALLFTLVLSSVVIYELASIENEAITFAEAVDSTSRQLLLAAYLDT